jgi:hypothetical protein
MQSDSLQPTDQEPRAGAGARLLSRAASAWFAAALLGQTAFLAYLLMFYGPTLVTGDFAGWARNENLIDGYVAGDRTGNLQFAIHVAMAALATASGALQLMPAIRNRAPAFHRWNGRAFLAACLVAALGGLWLVWVRGTQTSVFNTAGISLNAVLMLATAAMAWRLALKRDFARHQRWAMRLFLIAHGVWFLRLGMVAWGVLTGGFAMGTFFNVWVFGSYLVPWAIYEIYWRVRARGGDGAQAACAGALALLAGLTALGGVGAFLGIWLPLL